VNALERHPEVFETTSRIEYVPGAAKLLLKGGTTDPVPLPKSQFHADTPVLVEVKRIGRSTQKVSDKLKAAIGFTSIRAIVCCAVSDLHPLAKETQCFTIRLFPLPEYE
jgi:hypothetical protein